MHLTKKIIVGFVLISFVLSLFPPLTASAVETTTSSPSMFSTFSSIPALASYLPFLVTGTKAPDAVRDKVAVLAGDDISCSKSITQCLTLVVYWIGPLVASKVAYVGAYFFSIVIQLSLNSTAYALNFLTDGWTTVRDLANMAFIFILVYIAMTVMLQAETAGTIKTLAVVVVIALLVNFSFFFTRVVIDAGNILAMQFYNAIPMAKGAEGSDLTINGVKDLSASIMGATSPQVLLNTEMFQKATVIAGDSSWGALGMYTIIFLSLAAMMWMLFFAFMQVGIKFLLRIVGLWFVLIASPLAFVARTMPKTKHFYDQWQDYLIRFSLYPAIFLFMFLILTRFAGSLIDGKGGGNIFNAVSNTISTATTASGETTAMGVIASIGIRMGFVLALMYVALKVSDWVVTEGSSIAGAVTNRISGAAKGIGRFGGGLPIRGIAAGGGALGRVTLGAGGQALNRSAWARGLEARGGVAGLFGRGIRGAGKFAGNRTFDVRNIPGAGNVLGAGGALNVGTGKSGGYIKRTADAAAAKEKRGKDLEPTAGEKQKALEKTKAGFKYQNTKENNTRILSDAEEKIKKANDEIAELDKYGYGADEAKKQKEDALKTVQAAKEALAENEKYLISESKKISGEGSSKVYGESLLKSFNLASGNPGFVTRSSQEAAAKLLKEKSKKDKLAEAATDYAKEEGSDETPPDGGGSSGGGGAKGTGGGSSTPASGTDSTSTAGTGTHASFNQNLGPKVEQNTEVLKRIERLLRKQSNSAQYTSTASSPEINVTELGKAIGKSVAKNLEKSGTINVAPRSRSNPSTTPHQPPKPSNDNEQNPPEVKAA